ncbi:MAG: hypothetical protein ACFFAU_18735 [Candidatus Hodarchaeota archaeon]
MKEVFLRIFKFWLMSWYILVSVLLILSYILNWGVYIPLNDEETPNILSKLYVIFLISFSWPLFMSVLTGLFILGYEGTRIPHIFHPYFWPFYLTASSALIFTLIMRKNDNKGRIRRYFSVWGCKICVKICSKRDFS